MLKDIKHLNLRKYILILTNVFAELHEFFTIGN